MTTPITQHEGKKYLTRIYGAPGTSHGEVMVNGSPTHWIEVDVYCVLDAFPITSHAVGHAIKKLLFAGKRNKGDYRADLVGAIDAINRAIEEHDRRNAVKITELPPLPIVHSDFFFDIKTIMEESIRGTDRVTISPPDSPPGASQPGDLQAGGRDNPQPTGGEGHPAGGKDESHGEGTGGTQAHRVTRTSFDTLPRGPQELGTAAPNPDFDGTYPLPEERRADFTDRRRLGGSPGNPKEIDDE